MLFGFFFLVWFVWLFSNFVFILVDGGGFLFVLEIFSLLHFMDCSEVARFEGVITECRTSEFF